MDGFGRVARGLHTLVWGLLSAWGGVVSVVVILAALDHVLSQCGWSPKVASSSPQVSVPGQVSLVTVSVCVVVSVWVCVCLCVCVGACI